MESKKYLELFSELETIKALKKAGLISQQEYEKLRQSLLNSYPPEISFFFS